MTHHIITIFICLVAVLVGSLACQNMTSKQDTVTVTFENNLNPDHPKNQNTMLERKQNNWQF